MNRLPCPPYRVGLRKRDRVCCARCAGHCASVRLGHGGHGSSVARRVHLLLPLRWPARSGWPLATVHNIAPLSLLCCDDRPSPSCCRRSRLPCNVCRVCGRADVGMRMYKSHNSHSRRWPMSAAPSVPPAPCPLPQAPCLLYHASCTMQHHSRMTLPFCYHAVTSARGTSVPRRVNRTQHVAQRISSTA